MRILQFCVVLGCLLALTQGFGTLCGTNGKPEPYKPLTEEQLAVLKKGPSAPRPNMRVAFVGDIGPNDLVLRLIKSKNPAFVLIAGDFDYGDNPARFEQRLADIFGDDTPIFPSIGNHDLLAWYPGTFDAVGYGQRFADRLKRANVAQYCVNSIATDAPGLNTVCNYNGLLFVLSGVGTWGLNHVEFIDQVFTETPAIWKVVTWHKNQRLMQIGSKFDEVGWPVYEISRVHGAIINTGHEHSYCRSKNMALYSSSPRVANEDRAIRLRTSPTGQNLAWVTGLGGHSIRPWLFELEQNPWWASVAATQNGAVRSSMFCDFNVNNDTRKAHCEYIDTNGRVWDSFDIYSDLRVASNDTEADAKVAQIEKLKRAEYMAECVSAFVQLPVASSDDDAVVAVNDLTAATMPAQAIEARGDVMSLNYNVDGSAHAALLSFSFESSSSSPAIGGGAAARLLGKRKPSINSAHIQVKGIQGQGVTQLQIRGVLSGTDQDLELTEAAVEWVLEDNEYDWEGGEVWVSPNVASIVEELLSKRVGHVSHLRMLVVPRPSEQVVSPAPRTFFATDSSFCNAPHLAIELAPRRDCAHTL